MVFRKFLPNRPYTQAVRKITCCGCLWRTSRSPASLERPYAPTGLTLEKGTLLGKGTVAAAVTSAGAVTVGDSATKAGLLTVTGSYSQESTGILDVAVGGTTAGSQYSQLAVSNGVSLGGTLNIKLIGGFTPAIGDRFTIVTGSAVTGQFTKVNGTNIGSSAHFEVSYTSTAVTLTVGSGT